MKYTIYILLSLFAVSSIAQTTLTSELLEAKAFRFSLEENNRLSPETANVWKGIIGENQFVGIAEVHNSSQLSFFTVGLLEVLQEKGFEHFALELGPHSAEILQELSRDALKTADNIRQMNNEYGKNAFSKVPLIFADKVEDAAFIAKASKLSYTFWGLDQEFTFSYEMHIDRIYELAEEKSEELKASYEEVKKLVSKNIFKNKVDGMGKNCWLLQNKSIKRFFGFFEDNAKASQIINDLKSSWDIYCRYESGKASNQIRANYMKQNFDSLYRLAQTRNPDPKVLAKFGGVHLTHGKSPFGVNDLGMHLHTKAEENGTGFLSIRHLIAYRNGRSNIGRSGWKGVTMFLELGRKDQWTLVDLRPFREKLLNGELTTNEKYEHELKSYDILLIPPDDWVGKINY